MGMGFFEYLGMGLGMGVGFFEYLGVGLGWGVGNPHPDPNGWVFWVQLTAITITITNSNSNNNNNNSDNGGSSSKVSKNFINFFFGSFY